MQNLKKHLKQFKLDEVLILISNFSKEMFNKEEFALEHPIQVYNNKKLSFKDNTPFVKYQRPDSWYVPPR